jgi:hypothetical protein
MGEGAGLVAARLTAWGLGRFRRSGAGREAPGPMRDVRLDISDQTVLSPARLSAEHHSNMILQRTKAALAAAKSRGNP